MHENSTWSNSHPEPQRPADPLVGLRIDERYLIEKELGHGGVGAVYLARDLKLHQKPVVVKVLLEKSTRDQWTVQKFLQEKEALARVDHPGVVGILDTGELPTGKPYLVMQFVGGISLRSALKDTPEGMDLERVASIVRQVGSALSAVHDKGIFHRDLKPENIMLQTLGRGAEQVKIVDFGIAKIKESVIAPSTVTGSATAGTLVYMSPEQLYGIKVTAASDIYSFGIIAYELVTGRRPFNPESIAHLSDLQRQGIRVKPGDLRSRLPAEAERMILKALSYESADRYKNAQEFGDALASALLNEDETLKQPASWAELPSTIVDEPLRGAVEPAPVQEQQAVQRSKPWINDWLLLVVSIVLVAGVEIGIAALYSRATSDPGSTADGPTELPTRSVTYSLTVQKMRDGKPYQEPFQSSGQEIFESGYKFRLNVSSPESGYMYVFNESIDEKTKQSSFNIIYPTPKTNEGSARLDSNAVLQTNWNTFAGQAGTELFWMIWSASPVTALETAKDAAFKDPEGAINEVTIKDNLKQFLFRYSERKPETTKDTARRQTTVSTAGDVLVKLVELEHR